MSAAIDLGTVLLAEADPTLSRWEKDVLGALARWDEQRPPPTLDSLAETLSIRDEARPFVFAAVARLENAGWLPRGAIR